MTSTQRTRDHATRAGYRQDSASERKDAAVAQMQV
jgi:hypothetical protein